MLLQDFLTGSAARGPDREVLLYGRNRITYGRLLAAARSVAAWIDDLGLEAGFRGALLTDEPFEYLASYFGILMAGGTVVGLNTQTSDRSLLYTLQDSEAALLIANRKFSRHLHRVLPFARSLVALAVTGSRDPVPGAANLRYENLTDLLASTTVADRIFPYQSPCDLAQIIYTSGTTGQPKGVMLRHVNLVANTRSIIDYLHLNEDDRVMAVLPFFYSYGNSVMLTHIAAGGALVVNQSFMYPNVILQQMVEHRVTGFSGVPSSYAILLSRSAIETFTFPDLRYITQAGAAMSPALVHRLKKVFPGVDIYIMYGQTEASARLSYLDPGEVEKRPDSIGRAIPGVELQLLDRDGRPVPPGTTGEIVARGPNVMAGYWRRPEETRAVLRREGLWTGDLARQDDEGFFYIVSRKSDIIKSGSHRIGPREIEDTIAEHPAVEEVAVVGIPDDILDERIRACVVLRHDAACSDKELLKHCRIELPAYKVPQEIVFLEHLPRTATGKIRKSELKTPGVPT